MKRLVSVLAAGVAGMLFVSACALPQTGQVSPATAKAQPAVTIIPSPTTGEISPEPPAGPTVEPDAGEQKTVTLDDQGQTITLAVGERFLLSLGEGYSWEVEISDQDVVSRVQNIAVVRGSQGVYEGQQPGTATLSAVGDPACRQSKPPCAMPSTLFRVTIVVS